MHQIQLLRKYQVRPQKTRGQNFLIDENIQKKIIGRLGLSEKDYVLEIGSGLGALTEGLLQAGAQVYAVEKDRNLSEALKAELGVHPNLHLLNEDILKIHLKKLLPEKSGAKRSAKWKVVGNLPYFITTPVLFYLIDQKQWIEWAMVMIQKEVAERILAQPGNKSYGRLTLALRYHADISHEFDVSKNSFTPVPQVDSAVIKMVFHQRKVAGLDEDLMFKIIQAAFSTRRKNILNCLSSSPLPPSRDEWKKILEQLKIPLNSRAEELLLKDYMDLTKKVSV